MSAAAYGNVRLRECKNTEFVWELKRGFEQGGRLRARECLANSTVCNIICISCQEERMANIPYTKAYTPNINKQIDKQTDPPK